MRKLSKTQPPKMARCPHCNRILPDAWVKSQGASLMGKASGKRKARSGTEFAQEAQRRAARRLAHFKWRTEHPERWQEILAKQREYRRNKRKGVQ